MGIVFLTVFAARGILTHTHAHTHARTHTHQPEKEHFSGVLKINIDKFTIVVSSAYFMKLIFCQQ